MLKFSFFLGLACFLVVAPVQGSLEDDLQDFLNQIKDGNISDAVQRQLNKTRAQLEASIDILTSENFKKLTLKTLLTPELRSVFKLLENNVVDPTRLQQLIQDVLNLFKPNKLSDNNQDNSLLPQPDVLIAVLKSLFDAIVDLPQNYPGLRDLFVELQKVDYDSLLQKINSWPETKQFLGDLHKAGFSQQDLRKNFRFLTVLHDILTSSEK